MSDFEELPEFQDMPEPTKDHIRNIASLLEEYTAPIDGPDNPDLEELTAALMNTFETLKFFGQEIEEFSDIETMANMAATYLGVAYNMGLRRANADCIYQIERAVAQLDPDWLSDELNLEQMFNKTLAVRAQLQKFLKDMEE